MCGMHSAVVIAFVASISFGFWDLVDFGYWYFLHRRDISYTQNNFFPDNRISDIFILKSSKFSTTSVIVSSSSRLVLSSLIKLLSRISLLQPIFDPNMLNAQSDQSHFVHKLFSQWKSCLLSLDFLVDLPESFTIRLIFLRFWCEWTHLLWLADQY